MSLSSAELQRYARHLTLTEIGISGQESLKAAKVLLIGAGGLGSPAALYLAAAGIGTLGMVDSDVVDVTNLQRQILHDTAAINTPKTTSARARLQALNPEVHVETFETRLTSQNAREIISGFDIVIDGSDNFPTRYLANDACILEKKPLVYGSIFRFEGQLSLFGMPGGPCYRCLFADPPPPELVPSCETAGVLGVLPGIIGSLQALEAIKWIVKAGTSTSRRLVIFDALTLKFREIAIKRDPECPVCGDHPTLTELIDYEWFCGVTTKVKEPALMEISPVQLQQDLAAGRQLLLLDVREQWEYDLVHLPDAQLKPLRQLPTRIGEISKDDTIITICHSGQRSRAARDFLLQQGFTKVSNLTGGIDAWAREVEPGMARY